MMWHSSCALPLQNTLLFHCDRVRDRMAQRAPLVLPLQYVGSCELQLMMNWSAGVLCAIFSRPFLVPISDTSKSSPHLADSQSCWVFTAQMMSCNNVRKTWVHIADLLRLEWLISPDFVWCMGDVILHASREGSCMIAAQYGLLLRSCCMVPVSQ